MPEFLQGMEFNYETMLLATAISFIIAVILIGVIVAPINRSRLKKLRTALEKEITNSEQLRMQLGTELNALQQKFHQTEVKITEQTAQITQLEKEKQAAQAQAERVPTLDLSLNQKNQELSQLTLRLQEYEKQQASLQESWKSSLAEKDATINGLTASLDEQKLQIAQIEQLQTEFTELQHAKHELQQQLDNTLQQLQTKLAEAEQSKLEHQQQSEKNRQQLQSELMQVQQSKLELQQQLDSSLLQAERLEQRLTERVAKSGGGGKPSEKLEQQQTILRLQDSNQALEKKLLETEAVVNELTARNAKKPADVETELSQKIAALNTALSEQSNYIFRLEYDLEVKKALMSDKNSPLKTIPAAILAKQEQAEARILELEQKLNPKRKDVKKTVEKIESKPLELLNPAKHQLDEIADKATHLPEYFKGFFKKLDKQAEVVEPIKAAAAKKSAPEKPKQAEESAVKESKATGGLKSFFKKLDKQAEVVEPLQATAAKKSAPEKSKQTEEKTVKESKASGGLKGFFKKLDQQAEVVEPLKSSKQRQTEDSPIEESEASGGLKGFFKKQLKK